MLTFLIFFLLFLTNNSFVNSASLSTIAPIQFSNGWSAAAAAPIQTEQRRKQPTILKTTMKLHILSNVVSVFKYLPEPIVEKSINLYNQGKIDKLLTLLTAVDRLRQLQQFRKCNAIFSFQLCSNSSAQPFFLWAKMSANQIVNG